MIPLFGSAQKQDTDLLYIPELVFGTSAASNKIFPDRKLQKQAFFSLAWDHKNNTQEWVQWLNSPRTGISVGYTDFGNSESLGSAFSLMSFLEFKAFKKKRLKAHIGVGGSYFTKRFDPETNFFNRAVSTDFTWSLRAFLHYTFLEKKKVDYRVGVGVFHHSNGHTRLPNNGYNSFLVSLSAAIKHTESNPIEKEIHEKSKYNYVTLRTGIGQNVLNDGFPFNNKKEVYAISFEYGKVYNKIFKIGAGAYYRFYEHYYDYINDNESLVQDGREFESLKENPWWNGSSYGVYIKGELLLNHIGIELLLGGSFHKPAYKIDWRINEGWDFAPRDIPETGWVLGELGSKYKFKNAIATRAGFKYYLKGTNKFCVNNLYAGVFINANLGQADFTEIGIGYVYRWKPKKKS